MTAQALPDTDGSESASPVGLTSGQVAKARLVEGRNELVQVAPSTLVGRIGSQIRDPMILLLLGAAAVTVWLGDAVDTCVILAVVVLNSAIGVVQEGKAERSLAALESMAAPVAHVLRDGALQVVPAADLVTGDVVRLAAGDIVPADVALTAAHDVQFDESMMTGESMPIARSAGEEALSGTLVTRGRAAATVVRIGSVSSLGRIASLVAASPRQPTPLQRRLGDLSRVLVIAAGAVSCVVFGIGLAQGRDAGEMLIVAVSLAVAAVPESLPAVVSVALALGAYRMSRRSAIVRRLPAVETLGSVTVIATDKTGTLTQNRMTVQAGWVPAGYFVFAAAGGYTAPGPTVSADDLRLRPLLEAAALCNDARLTRNQDGAEVLVGDPLDVALLHLASTSGIDPDRLRGRVPRIAETPFDNAKRTMTTTHSLVSGRPVQIVKGAPESVFGMLSKAPGPSAGAAATALAESGMRVIAIASTRPHLVADGSTADELALLGLVAIADPVRSSAHDVVRACQRAGVRVVMITGDHPATARAIAEQVGIETNGGVVHAEGMDAADLAGHADAAQVYARTRPHQKVEIVRTLQDRGHVVAMTGDGVNDAPALRAADIGVAMGGRGTEVARQAAELVLADDDLRTVVVAIEEGRRITANIRAFLRYALAGGWAEVLVMVAGPALGIALPLLPAQILWINMLTHGLPGVAFGGRPADPASMRTPARSAEQAVLGGGLWRGVLLMGAAIAAVSLVAGLWAPEGSVSTHIFLVLGMAQLGVGLAFRGRGTGQGGGGQLLAAIGLAAGLQLAAVTVAPLQRVLDTRNIGPGNLAVLLILAAVPGILVAASQRLRRITDETEVGQ